MKDNEMPEPCEQKDTIEDIWDAVEDIKAGQKEGLSELKADIKSLVSEFRDVTREMRDILVEGREIKTRLSTDEKSIDILFTNIREIKGEMGNCQTSLRSDLLDIQKWIHKEEGARGLFRYGLPIICTVITTVLAVVVWVSTTPDMPVNNHSHKVETHAQHD